MKRKTILAAFCFATSLIGGNLAAQTQAEFYEQVKDLTEVKGYILSPSFEDAVPWQPVTPNWENNGYQGQNNNAFPEMTGKVYCEKFIGNGSNIADSYIYQTCSLPNGSYVISIDAKATQTDQGGITGFYFVARDGDWGETADLLKEPITGPLNFTVEEDGTTKTIITYYIPITITSGKMTVGILAESATANYVRFDNVRLFTSDPVFVLKDGILNKLAQLEGMITEEGLPGGYYTLLHSGDNPLYDSATEISNTSMDKDELISMADSLDAVIARAETGRQLFQTFLNGIEKAEELKSANYPGIEELEQAFNDALDLSQDTKAFNAEIEKGIAVLKEAIKTYKLSQISTATATSPVEVTFLIDTPNFTKDPDFEEGDITNKDIPFKGAWLTNNVYSPAFSDHDSRLNYCNQKNCWNNWSRSFYSLDLYQTLRNMPEGVYELKMLTCCDGALGNARGYASSSNGAVYSPVHSIPTTEKPFANMAQWEELTTSKIYVAANDTLRIGMTSSNAEGNNTTGWFCATQFQLFYYGQGNANQQVLEMKLAEIKALDIEGTMTEKALAELRAVIEKAQTLYDNGTFEGDEYTTALAEIERMIPLTKTRVEAYGKFSKKDTEIADFVNRGESECCDLIALIQEEYANKIEQNADIDAAEFEQYTNELDQYLTFANNYMTYEAYTSNPNFELANLQQYAASLYEVLEFVEENRVSSLPEAKQKLETALQILFSKSCKEGDLTYLVNNPSFEENTGGAPAGWTNKGFNIADNQNFKLNDNPAYTGANFCEQWVAGPKKLGNMQIYQTAKLPNGNYTITVDAMAFQQGDASVTDIVGYYLVAKDGAWDNGSNLIKEQVLYPYKEITAEEDTIITYSINLDVARGEMTFGMITENTNANWIMCDNFLITLNRLSGVGVEEIRDGLSEENAPVYTEGRRIIAPEEAVIYDINGLPVAKSGEMQSGVYFVRVGSKTYKVLIP